VLLVTCEKSRAALHLFVACTATKGGRGKKSNQSYQNQEMQQDSQMSNMKQHMLGLEPSFHCLTCNLSFRVLLMRLSLFRLNKHPVPIR
jgi:hypothetical protein